MFLELVTPGTRMFTGFKIYEVWTFKGVFDPEDIMKPATAMSHIKGVSLSTLRWSLGRRSF